MSLVEIEELVLIDVGVIPDAGAANPSSPVGPEHRRARTSKRRRRRHVLMRVDKLEPTDPTSEFIVVRLGFGIAEHNCFAAAERRLFVAYVAVGGVLLENFRAGEKTGGFGRIGGGLGWSKRGSASGTARKTRNVRPYLPDGWKVYAAPCEATTHNGGSVVGSGGVLAVAKSAEPPPRPFLRLPDLRHPFPPLAASRSIL
nr:hypothetical protein Iba_chr05bCG10370 [Ipomoea batatas]